MKKLISISILVVALIIGYNVFAQVSINADGSEPEPSAMLDVKSSDKGLLIPRMTTSEIEAIYLPADGLQVYNTDNGKLYIFVMNDFEWKELSYATGNIQPNATYTIGTGGTCNNTVVNGVYYVSVLLQPYNFITIEVDVSALGQYTIATDTVNGYYFIATGVFATTGNHTIILTGGGIPLYEQTDSFTVNASNNGGTCTFGVTTQVSLTFLCGLEFQDPRDGQLYNTVEIDTQCWMAENINFGTMILLHNPQLQQTPEIFEKYCYQNDTNICNEYGGLYQWDEVMQHVTTAGVQGICMDGWHIPTDAEWTILSDYLGGESIAGGKMKETGFVHWNQPNTGATNESEFTALPGGLKQYYTSSVGALNDAGFFWSSTLINVRAWARYVQANSELITRESRYHEAAFSVRCIKN